MTDLRSKSREAKNNTFSRTEFHSNHPMPIINSLAMLQLLADTLRH